MEGDNRVLIAESDLRVAEAVSVALGDAYRIAVVRRGDALEDELLRNPYDLAIVNLNLPVRLGVAVLRRFERHTRCLFRTPVPVIAVTELNETHPAITVARNLKSVRVILHKPYPMHLLGCLALEILEASSRETSSLLSAPCQSTGAAC